jgi:hypothetical protein
MNCIDIEKNTDDAMEIYDTNDDGTINIGDDVT